MKFNILNICYCYTKYCYYHFDSFKFKFDISQNKYLLFKYSSRLLTKPSFPLLLRIKLGCITSRENPVMGDEFWLVVVCHRTVVFHGNRNNTWDINKSSTAIYSDILYTFKTHASLSTVRSSQMFQFELGRITWMLQYTKNAILYFSFIFQRGDRDY